MGDPAGAAAHVKETLKPQRAHANLHSREKFRSHRASRRHPRTRTLMLKGFSFLKESVMRMPFLNRVFVKINISYIVNL
jgi:hypothetical protein